MLEQYDLGNLMVLDIETVSQYSSFDHVPEPFQKLWELKTQYQRKEETPDTFYERAGIWAEFGKIICISVGIFTGGKKMGLRVKSFSSHDEKQILEDFSALLNSQPPALILCAHNGKEFDFPYICRRMLINGVKIPAQLEISGRKPWEINHLDTMELWKFGDYKNYTSLNLLTAIFNIPTPKDDIDGSQVGHVYWVENNLDRIAIYCEKDVIATAQLLRRYRGEELITDESITIVGRSMLQVDDLTIKFKTQSGFFEAVKGVSFHLNKGETIGIVGESGSGKSVTSLAMMRLLDEKQTVIGGQVSLNGQSLCKLPEDEMQKIRGHQIAMIFQEPMTSLNPVLTCGFQITEAIRLHLGVNKAEAKKRTIGLFKEVQLPRPEAIFDSYPHQISGGQKQRVMIAMALSCNPEILIADEPTTALDVTVQKTIIELLHKLKAERNMSLIFISHDLGVISEIADRVLVMYKGEVVERAAVKTLFAHPNHPYTKGLLSCRPAPALHLKKLPVIGDFLDTENKRVASIEKIREGYAYKPGEIAERKSRLYAQEPLLRIGQLNTWFQTKRNLLGKSKEFVKAVKEVSFDVYPGETLGLVGESGCGKTTLGRSILRLIEPTSGTINFENIDLRSLKTNDLREIRRDMQIIFQDPYSSLNPRLTVGDSLMEPLEVHQFYANNTKRKKKVMELLERVNLLPEHFNRYPHEFSGGQRQRIVIARALALQPKFIICDESVSALDVSVQAQVLNLIRELQEEFKLTYIFISHDLAVIKHISDRMMVMNKGEIVEMGDPDEIYYKPKEEYTKKLISSIPGN